MAKKVNATSATNDTNDLVKKADCDANNVEIEQKITDHGKCINTQEFDKLMTENFAERSKQTNLASKN